MSINKMKFTEIAENEIPPLIEENDSLETETETENLDVFTKLTEELNKNEEIKKQLSLEKARADRLQKKVQFIQDNQDLFNQLKQVYVRIKDSKGNMQTDRAIQDVASQTNTTECLQTSLSHITTVSKQDLAEIAQLVRELKTVVSKGGKRVFAALETEKYRDVEVRKKMEAENQLLKKELFHTSSELERLRTSAGAGPREVSLLRRIVAKLIIAGCDLSTLSSRETQLARHLAKRYEQKHFEMEKKMLDNADQEDDTPSSQCDTPRSSFTPSTPRTPSSAKEIYSTPRWVRGKDVP